MSWHSGPDERILKICCAKLFSKNLLFLIFLVRYNRLVISRIIFILYNVILFVYCFCFKNVNLVYSRYCIEIRTLSKSCYQYVFNSFLLAHSLLWVIETVPKQYNKSHWENVKCLQGSFKAHFTKIKGILWVWPWETFFYNYASILW